MVDRVSLSIIIGGDLPAAQRAALLSHIQAEGLALDYDADAFEDGDFPLDASLSLYAHEVAWGRADVLEGFCVRQGLAFVRWSGGSAAQFGPERVVFTGTGAVATYAADEDDAVILSRDEAERLGSFEAIMTHFAAAYFAVPPLRFV
jgi:hypothetical protein